MPPNIAVWGDSMAYGFIPQLRSIYPDRSVYDGSVLSQTSTQIAARMTADTEHREWITILWYGSVNRPESETIKLDLARSVAALGQNARYVIFSAFNQDLDTVGTLIHTAMVQMHADLAALYPDNFIDMRRYVVDAYDPNSAADRADFAKDIPPTSLRWDDIHLRDEGYLYIARRLQQFITDRGW